MCGAKHAGPLDSWILSTEQDRLLRYLSRYWIRHLERSDPKSCEIDMMYNFLKKHLLHWLEAISIFGVISEASGELEKL